jgi:hypothetical protein
LHHDTCTGTLAKERIILLDDLVVFNRYNRFRGINNLFCIVDAIDGSDLDASYTALAHEGHFDWEEHSRIVTTNGELQRTRAVFGRNNRNGPVDRMA